MASNICQRLVNKVWGSYAFDLDKVPETEGVYAIGDTIGKVAFVGRSKQLGRRLRQHKYAGVLAIDQLVKQD